MMQRCAIMVAFSIENAKKIYILFTQIGKISSFILLNWRGFCDGICQQTDEIKHDASDPRRDDYNTCEDSPDLRSGQAMWPLKINYKHMKL